MQFKYERREGYAVPVLVVINDEEKRDYWGRKGARRRRIHHGGNKPEFRPGIRFV